MDERKKHILAGLGVILVIALCVGSLWLLFRDVRTATGISDPVNERLSDAQREQQEAAGALDEAIGRASDSQGTAAELTGRIDHSQGLAHDIAEANAGAGEGAGRAETAVGEAAEAIDRAAGLADECQELIRGSESILAKYGE